MKKIIVLLLAFSNSLIAGPIRHDAGEFTVYTFEENKNQTNALIEAVQQAYDAFEFYFSFPADPITVVGFPDAASLQQADYENIAVSGKLLPFIVAPEQNLNDRPDKGPKLYPALGLKISFTGQLWQVHEVLAQLTAVNGLSEVNVNDRLVSINGIKLTAETDISGLLNQIQTGTTFPIVVEQGDQKLKIPAKKLNLKVQEQNISTKKTAEVMLGALQHEIGHLLLIAAVDDGPVTDNQQQAQISGDKNYGSKKAPDWLDELVANMCEGDAVKEIHRGAIKEVSDLMPLEILLNTRHPSLDSIIESQAYKSQLKGDGATQTIFLTIEDFTAEEQDKITAQTGTFYGSSLLFGEYLYHRGGNYLLNDLVEQINQHSEFSFTNYIANNDALANKLEELESDFHGFVRTKLGIE